MIKSIISDGPIAILRGGRRDCAKAISYFINKIETYTKSTKNTHELKTLNKALKFMEEAEGSPENSPEFLTDAFEKLATTVGLPLIQQSLALARYNSILRDGSFFNFEGVIRSNDNIDAEKREKFSRLIRKLFANSGFMNEMRFKFVFAYKLFKKITYIDGSTGPQTNIFDTFENGMISLTDGEMDNIDALIELHISNTCLRVIGANLYVRYVTISNSTFDFVSAIPRRDIFTPIVHPRFFHVQTRKEVYLANADTYQIIASGAGGSLRAVEKNSKVTKGELDALADVFEAPLKDMRAAFAYSSTTGERENENNIKFLFSSLNEFIQNKKTQNLDEKDSQYLEEIEARLENFSYNLYSTAMAVGKNVNAHSAELSTNAFTGYQLLVKSTAEAKDIATYAIRAVENTQGDVTRLTCIPLSGGYRHLFSIHNSVIVGKATGCFSTAPKLITASKLLETLDSISEAERANLSQIEKRKAASLVAFMRANIAATNRDWTLANSFANQSVEALEMPVSKPIAISDTHAAKAKLILQETLFLSSLAKRAIAHNDQPVKRRAKWLNLAAQDLFNSMRTTIEIPVETRAFETIYDPITVRQALAAFGLMVEVLILSTTAERQSEPLSEEFQNIVPDNNISRIIWNKMPSLRKFMSVKICDLGILTAMHTDIDFCIREIQTIIRSFEANNSSLHNKEFWNYVLLRALEMKSFFATAIASGSIVFNDNSTERINNIGIPTELLEKAAKKHHQFLEKLTASEPEFTNNMADNYPLLESLLTIGKIEVLRERGVFEKQAHSIEIEDFLKFQHLFDKVDNSCSKLYRRGLPREVIRRMKVIYVKDLIRLFGEKKKRLQQKYLQI